MRVGAIGATAATACLVATVCWSPGSRQAVARSPARQVRPTPPVPRTSSEAARRAAFGCWAQAQARSNREREAVEAWDPAVTARINPETWRRRTVASDPDGALRQARRLADRALVLAQTPAERAAAARLQSHLAYEAADRAGEARAARLLRVLEPHSAATQASLRRWAEPAAMPRAPFHAGPGGCDPRS